MSVASDGRIDDVGRGPGLAIGDIKGFPARLSRLVTVIGQAVSDRIAASGFGRPMIVRRRRSKRFAGVLALHWLARVAEMTIGEWLGAIRHRVGVTIIVGLCALGLIAALLLPEEEEGAATVPAISTAQAVTANAAPTVAHVNAAGSNAAGLNAGRAAILPPLPGATSNPARALLPAAELRAAIGPEIWVAVRRPIAVYNLEGPETEAADFTHRVAMRGKHARQDVMTWTARAERKTPATRPAIHMVVERYEQAAPTFRPLYSDLAARAAEQGVAIDRMNASGEIAAKFGALEVADATLSTEQGQLGCLLYRRIDTIGLTISGWYCGTAQRPADRVSLVCFLDRLDLVGAGQDSALKRHFASAERNRRSCGGARQSGRRLTWLDHEAPMPALKLSASAR